MNRFQGVNGKSVRPLYQQLKGQHPTLSVAVHCDVHEECWACTGTGLLPSNSRYLCSTCSGYGTTITKIGIEVSIHSF